MMTLMPGRLILTGHAGPAVGPLSNGDVVEVEIEGVGILGNPVTKEAGAAT
jgi:2-keto-4-pentenoate hydratase/2-oxohepta-3-ene-1,7-dioic acid hydratase in catechol pathway